MLTATGTTSLRALPASRVDVSVYPPRSGEIYACDAQLMIAGWRLSGTLRVGPENRARHAMCSRTRTG